MRIFQWIKGSMSIHTPFRDITKRKFRPYMGTKLAYLFLWIVLALLLLAVRMVKITAENYDDYAVNVFSNYNYTSSEITAPRGTITDRNGNILAASEASYILILEPKTILSKDYYKTPTVQALCSILGLNQEELLRVLEEQSDSYYYRYRIDNNSAVLTFTAEQVTAYEQMVRNVNVTSAKKKLAAVAELFGMSTEEVQQSGTLEKYTKFQLQGVWFETRYDRIYPYNSLACKVVGYYASNYPDASTGIEKVYNSQLTGTEGKSYGYLNGDYNLSSQTVDAVAGDTIVSTIDIGIQMLIEQNIAEFMEEIGAENVGVIAMNPNNGEILGMANDTVYDLNNPSAAPSGYTQAEWDALSDEEKTIKMNEVIRNFCVSSSYEPGSTFKPLTMAMGLEEGALTGNEIFECNGFKIVDGWRIRCHNVDGCGTLDLMGALENSCNVSLMEIVNKIGKKDFTTYFNRFGFGKATGIDLPDEVSCSTLVYSDFTNQPDVTLACASFGQGFNVTMVQMAAAFSSLINGGYYYTPHVVKEIYNAEGVKVDTIDTNPVFRSISVNTSEFLKEALFSVVENGTGSYAQVEGYTIGGKTGTAQMVKDGNRVEDEYVISFISAAPIENPQILLYVVIDRPQNVETQNSSMESQLLAKAIWEDLLPYMNVHSNLDEYDYLVPAEPQPPIDDSYQGSFIEPETSESAQNPEETAPEESSSDIPADSSEDVPPETPVETPEVPSSDDVPETPEVPPELPVEPSSDVPPELPVEPSSDVPPELPAESSSDAIPEIPDTQPSDAVPEAPSSDIPLDTLPEVPVQ